MKVRDASIVVDDSMLFRALMAHLTTAIMTQVNMNDEFEAVGVQIDVQVDGQSYGYSVLHVATDYTYVSGMVLQHSVLIDEELAPNVLEYILVRCDVIEFEPLQRVYSMNEEDAVNYRGRTMLELLSELYT